MLKKKSAKQYYALKVIIRDTNSTIFEGNAVAVSSSNDKGEFDILPGHKDYISVLNNKVTVYNMEGQETSYDLTSGIIKVSEDKVEVFIGIGNLEKPMS